MLPAFISAFNEEIERSWGWKVNAEEKSMVVQTKSTVSFLTKYVFWGNIDCVESEFI